MNDFLTEFNQYWVQNPQSKNFTLSLLLIFIYLIIKKVVNHNIQRKKIDSDEKIFLKRKFNQYLTYFLLVVLFLLWFSQLQLFFVSIIAFAVAIVIAFKELIMCITGGIMIKSSKIFKEGQRIEVDGVRGFVIEKRLLTTKILEIGPEKYSQQTTGDIVSIPNSLVLDNIFKNQSYFKNYSVKAFTFKVCSIKYVKEFEKDLHKKAEEICKPYVQDAESAIRNFCQREGIIIPIVEPKTKIIVENGNDFSILIKLPVKNDLIADVEQELNRFFLDWKLAKTNTAQP